MRQKKYNYSQLHYEQELNAKKRRSIKNPEAFPDSQLNKEERRTGVLFFLRRILFPNLTDLLLNNLLLFLTCLPVFLLEHSVKMGLILVTAFGDDLSDAETGSCQQRDGIFQPLFDAVFRQRHIGGFSQDLIQIALRIVQVPLHGAPVHTPIVRLQILQQLAQDPAVPIGGFCDGAAVLCRCLADPVHKPDEQGKQHIPVSRLPCDLLPEHLLK